jgi:hypothetical protein
MFNFLRTPFLDWTKENPHRLQISASTIIFLSVDISIFFYTIFIRNGSHVTEYGLGRVFSSSAESGYFINFYVYY